MEKETLEEVANNANGYNVYAKETKAPIFNEGFIAGAKWQQERMFIEEKSFENKSLKWWMSLSMEEQVEIGLKYNKPTFNLTLRAIMFEFEQFKKK